MLLFVSAYYIFCCLLFIIILNVNILCMRKEGMVFVWSSLGTICLFLCCVCWFAILFALFVCFFLVLVQLVGGCVHSIILKLLKIYCRSVEEETR